MINKKAVSLLAALCAFASAAQAEVWINEIHYDPSPAANLLEFVEFYNPTGQAISLDGWALDGGIEQKPQLAGTG